MTGWLLAFVAPILCGSTVATILCTRFPRTMLPTDPNEYWFPAKRYGWGWGLPSRWQGWVVLAIYAVLLVVGIVGLHPGTVATDLSKPFQRGVEPGKLFTPATAATHLLDVIDELKRPDSGNCLDWSGETIVP